jgi:hypothetical protein
MNKEKIISLHNYYLLEIKELLNPCGRTRPAQVATKVISAIMSDKDINTIREKFYEIISRQYNQEMRGWYSDLKTIHEIDIHHKVNQLIEFYIEKCKLTNKENDYYKKLQRESYLS